MKGVQKIQPSSCKISHRDIMHSTGTRDGYMLYRIFKSH